jgi:hypothetical protein
VIPLLSYIPLIDPIEAFQNWWYLLLLPLSFGISVIYKALRMTSLEGFWSQVTVMTTQIVLGMIALAVCLVLLVQVLIPLLPVKSY